MGVNSERMREIDKFLSKKNLKKYLPKYSANFIAKKLFYPEFTTTADIVINRAKKYGISTHDLKSATKLENTRIEYKNTCIKKYKVDNVSKNTKIKKKKEKSAIIKYGVKNVFQSNEIKQKIRKTCLEKYGTETIGSLNLSKQNGYRSKFHRKVEEILIDVDIEFQSEVSNLCKKYNRLLKRQYSPIVDIFIKQYNLIIECYGNFWHANPKLYKSTDIFHCWDGQKTAKQIWKKDKSRIKQIKSFGYKVLIIWESDLLDVDKLKTRIINEISNNKNKKNNKIK